MEKTFFLALLLASAPLVAGASAAQPREFGGGYTRERLANLRANCSRLEWAKAERDAAVEAARPWVSKSDAELWEMIPGQDLPRCIDVGWDYNKTPHRMGCLKCGDEVFKFGNYPYNPDFDKAPWKLKCPSCGSVFPTNDFGKFYASAIDERGQFDPAKGDRSLLFNTDHPDPNDPLHTWGVDDGYGYTDASGRTHKYVGYYTWKLWGYIRSGVYRLSAAYTYTGDPAYARKAAIMLDRIADVYPDMDWKKYGDMGWFHSDGSSHRGKIDGRIWETGVLAGLADSYDRILSGTVDNPELFGFLSDVGGKYSLPRPKGTRADLVSNIDDNLLRCGFEGIQAGRVWGNEGMHQGAAAVCAIALDTEPDTSRWLDWIFSEGGGQIPGIIVGAMDRDGLGGEGAPGYSLIWSGQIGGMADRISDYGKYKAHDIYRDFPQFRNAVTAASRICLLGMATPPIGDSGAAGAVAKASIDAGALALQFERLRDPEIALAAIVANGGSAKGLHGSVWSKDPESLPNDLDQAARLAKNPRFTGSRNLPGFGLASLERGSGADGTALWMYYGRMDRHGHLDRLNIGLYALGVDLLPDLGYPEYAADWPPRTQWNNNTISHNTLVVDKAGQNRLLSAFPRLFAAAPDVRVVEIDSREAYSGMQEYSRVAALIDSPGGSYGVDVFRATGGSEHLLSFHGPAGDVSTSGLRMTDQPTGTYAGREVPFGDTASDSGFSYLYNVQRDQSPPPAFWIDWHAKDYRGLTGAEGIHLRWHCATAADELALADGDPAQNKAGNPRRLRYALLKRSSPKAATSAFAGVLEPYKGNPFISSVTPLDVTEGTDLGAALKVNFTGGGADLVAVAPPSPGKLVTREGLSLDSGFGYLRIKDGRVVKAFIAGGKELRFRDFTLECQGAFTGKVVRMDKDSSGEAELWLEPDVTGAERHAELVSASIPSIVGRQIIIDNDRALNACYDIVSARSEGRLWRISCGRVSFARSYADGKDYGKGFVYNFSEGDSFRIPVSASWEAEPR